MFYAWPPHCRKVLVSNKYRFFRFIIEISHIFKLCHRRKALKNFRKFISQEQHIRILIKGAYCFYFNSEIKIFYYLKKKLSRPKKAHEITFKLFLEYIKFCLWSNQDMKDWKSEHKIFRKKFQSFPINSP